MGELTSVEIDGVDYKAPGQVLELLQSVSEERDALKSLEGCLVRIMELASDYGCAAYDTTNETAKDVAVGLYVSGQIAEGALVNAGLLTLPSVLTRPKVTITDPPKGYTAKP